MIDFSGELTANQRAVLAVDTSDIFEAGAWAQVASDAGAAAVKFGLELITAYDVQACATAANNANVEWIADAKLDDIPTTVKKAMKNIINVDPQPSGITIHADAGVETLQTAQELAEESGVTLFAVTELTAKQPRQLQYSMEFILHHLGINHDELDADEVRKVFVHEKAFRAQRAGVKGLVAAATELENPIKMDPALRHMVTLIPGTRSRGKDAHDQANVMTPEEAIIRGASLLVIGRQVTESVEPEVELGRVIDEINQGLVRIGKA